MSSRAGATMRPDYYIEGNTVRRLDRQIEIPAERKKTQKVHAKNAPIQLGYLLVLTVAVVAIIASLIMYVSLQADIVNSVNTIAHMEEELNSLKLANDETYTKIVSGVNLEEIKYIAITQLGMTYAGEGQVVSYSSSNSDYCIQYSDIPE